MKILIALRFEPDLLIDMDAIANLIPLENSEVHLYHVFKKEIISLDLTTFEWPTPEEYKSLKKKGLKKLENLGDKIFKRYKLKKMSSFVELDFSAKEAIVKKIKKEKYDLVVVKTRGIHGFKGLFHSSVADYLVQHSPCPLLVLR